MAAPKRSRESTTDEFLDLPRHISLKIATTENDIKREISVVGQSDSRFCTNMKKKEKKGYFLACAAVTVMLKIEARPGCTRTRGYISRKQRRTKKVTSRLERD